MVLRKALTAEWPQNKRERDFPLLTEMPVCQMQPER